MAPLKLILRGLERLRHRKARRRAVLELRRSLALIVELEALEANVAARIKELFDPDRLVILRLDRQSGSYRASYVSGLDPELLENLPLDPDGRLARWFLVNASCLLLPQRRGVLGYLKASERELLERLDVQLCAPLLTRSYLLGLLLLGNDDRRRGFTQSDGELMMELANQVSLALQNATLYRDQEERLDRMHRADRLAAVGQLAAGVAHEVRNPLTAIRSTMQYLVSSLDTEDPKRELIGELIEEVDRIDSTVSGLLSLTRSGELEPREVDLVELVEQTASLLEIQARKLKIHLERSHDQGSLPIMGDAGQLKQVLLNVILNAFQAMPDGGRVEVTTGREGPGGAGLQGGAWAVARIRDTGPGIPPDQLERVFDPFFTTKSEGTGLGLAICGSIVERHGGEITLESTVGEGATVTLRLPYVLRKARTTGDSHGQDSDR